MRKTLLQGQRMRSLIQDLRFGIRLLAKEPGLAAIAVLTLAVGIGVNTAMFSVVDAYFLRPIPGKEPSRLVEIRGTGRQDTDEHVSYPQFEDLVRQSKTLAGALAFSTHIRFLHIQLNSTLIPVEIVSPNYFSVLGIAPFEGKTFSSDPRSQTPTGDDAIISYSLWRDSFAADPSIVGKLVELNAKDYAVIGVAPPRFRGLERLVPADVWLSAPAEDTRSQLESRSFRDFRVVGRLAPGVSAGQAQAELNTISNRLASQYPETDRDRRFAVVSSTARGEADLAPMALLMGAVVLILVICCGNLGGILLARSEARRQEIAVRSALGASRARIVRQLLTESVLLMIPGSCLALLFGAWLVRLQPFLTPPSPIPLRADLRIDAPVLVFTVCISLVSVLVFGLAPALQGSRMTLVRSPRPGIASAPASQRVRAVFVIAEVSLSFVLMSSAGLLVKSLLLTEREPLGFDGKVNLRLIDVAPAIVGKSGQQTLQYFSRVAERLRSFAGVDDVSFAERALLSSFGGGIDERVSIHQKEFNIKCNSVGPHYFRIIGTRILRGRDFGAVDLNGPPVVIIDQEMAKRFWPKTEPLGEHFKVDGKDFRIIGVVQDAKIEKVHEPVQPYMYFSFFQVPASFGTVLVKTKLQVPATTLKREMETIDPSIPIIDVTTTRRIIDNALWTDRISTLLAGTLSVLGIFMSTIGLYGVIANLVTRQTREIGIRIALGANKRDILRLVTEQGVRLSLFGICFGLLGAIGTARLLASVLQGLSPYDASVLFGSAAVAIITTLAATGIPALQAARLSPAVALRHE